jgi:hypothetical protein
MLGTLGAGGRGGPGIEGGAASAARCSIAGLASPTLGGNGCRGPERICPGFGGGGAGLVGIGMPRAPRGGTNGAPLPIGGRSG